MNENCESCPYAAEIALMKREVEDNRKTFENFCEEQRNRNESIGTRISDAEKQIIIMNERFSRIMKDTEDIKSKLEEIISKPAKHWDLVTTGFISGIVAFIAGFAMNAIF